MKVMNFKHAVSVLLIAALLVTLLLPVYADAATKTNSYTAKKFTYDDWCCAARTIRITTGW